MSGISGLVRSTRLFIGGNWKPASHSVPLTCPTTEEVFAHVDIGGREDIDDAVQAARKTFDKSWGLSSDPRHRAHILRKVGDLIRRDNERLALLEHKNVGKPMNEALFDVNESASYFDYYAGLAETSSQHEEIKVPDDNFHTKVVREPVGVVAAITPWNYPLLMASQKVAAAIAAGCTVVLKPSEITPLTSLELGCLSKEAGLPDGVLNIIPGMPDAGAALVSHPEVDKISFTGSERTGSWIMSEASKRICKVSLELGGKSAMIVFPDANIEKAIDWILMGFVYNAGQICSSTSRLIVHRDVYEKVVGKLVDKIKELHVGPVPNDWKTASVGPLVSRNQYEKVLQYIFRARKQGVTLACGGDRPGGVNKGFFINPTVFSDVPLDAEIWNEEIFGPVLSARSFATESEAIDIANNTRYGLAASLMTENVSHAHELASKIRSGVVWINCSQPAFVQAPWGGYKASGFGRELGRWGLEEFQEIKQITRCSPNFGYGWYDKTAK